MEPSGMYPEESLIPGKYRASVRFLRATTSWGIHGAIFVLGVLALPIAFFCFLGVTLALMPLVLTFQGLRFLWAFLGFKISLPKFWDHLFQKKEKG